MLLLSVVIGLLLTPWALADELLDEALVFAIVSRDLSKTQSLLAQGADPNAINDEDNSGSAMCRAAQRGMATFMEVLIEHGADVNQWFENAAMFDRTPLACAVSAGNVGAFELLLEAGADVSIELCPTCTQQTGMSMVENAVLSNRNELLWRLLKLDIATERDIETIVYAFENFSAGLRPLDNKVRQRIITWIREQGVEFEPKM